MYKNFSKLLSILFILAIICCLATTIPLGGNATAGEIIEMPIVTSESSKPEDIDPIESADETTNLQITDPVESTDETINLQITNPVESIDEIINSESTYPAESADETSGVNPPKHVLIMRLNASDALLNSSTISVDPTNPDVAPFTLMSKTMVPVRFIENLGAHVKYNGANEPVIVTFGDIVLSVEFGKDTMTRTAGKSDPETIRLPTSPSMVEGKTCVPIREIAEAIGFTVSYDSGSFVIVVSSVPLSSPELESFRQLGKDTLPSFIESVRSISAKKSSFTAKPGEIIQLSKTDILFIPATVGCNKLIYSSNNEKAATVTSQGRIEAVANGTAVITVSSHNGKTAAITVLVQDTPSPSQYMVALTFDDGPSIYTARILTALRENNSRATFFLLGSRVSSYANTIKQAKAQGCEIASHSWDHPNMNLLSASSIHSQLSRTQTAIYNVIGEYPKLLRPPYGNASSSVRSTSRELGLALVNWSVDPEDWKSLNSDAVYNAVLKNTKDGSVILLHDIYSSTASAAERLIPELNRRGYQVVTVSELFEAKGIKLAPGQMHYRAY